MSVSMPYEILKSVIEGHRGDIYIDLPGLGPVLVDKTNILSRLDFHGPSTKVSSGYVGKRAGETLLLAYRQEYRFSTQGETYEHSGT